MLVKHKIVVLDSATIAKVSHDYWSHNASLKEKSRAFILHLQDHGVFVAFTLTHVSELLRHNNEQVVWDRLKLLRRMPLIAWLRPYNRSWFPAGIPDLLCRELHAVVHSKASNWQEIMNVVRQELWETGVGHEMFVDDDALWTSIRQESICQHEHEKYVVSVDRTDPDEIGNLKIREILKFPLRPKEEWADYMRRFAQKMKSQLDRHGDERLGQTREVAVDFATKTLQRIRRFDETKGNLIRKMLRHQDVPDEFVFPEMTIRQYGELLIYAKRLKMLTENLHPAVELTMKDVPQETLPSYVLERKLSSIQRKAQRVRGSDTGDRFIAPLVFYADGIEVDNRTHEYLMQLRRSEPHIALLMRKFFTSSDYSKIPMLFSSK